MTTLKSQPDANHVTEEAKTEGNASNSENKSEKNCILDAVQNNNVSTALQKKKGNVYKPAKADYEKARQILLENNVVKLKPKPIVINLKNNAVENHPVSKNGDDDDDQAAEEAKEQPDSFVETLVIDVENSEDQIEELNREFEQKVEWLAEMIAISRRKFNSMKKKKKKRKVIPVKQTEDGKYECEKCKKQFASVSSIYSHQSVHRRVRPYKCKVCHMRFKDGSSLKNHSTIHTGEKPYECQECKNKFRLKGDLKKHLRTHTGERPFPCEVCGKKLTTKTTWTLHMKLHKGDKPFKCKKCDRRYVAQSCLNKHMKLAHKR
ncbi:zinc finger protein 436-like [Centruroides sculpturatus]|uniref:zinc finger protein 436-like n=1 Tax=Centruroides sculpturatus TaxID=218467 RepID=UPI000C6D5AC6|nr:zinc finger protein 436-like [Centruroides sculpturatus]XP_023229870.1 zinc finger protein 436-like [Centruroides sculpturatus]